MSDQSSKIKIGKFKDVHGLKGELYMILFVPDEDWLDEVESFYIGEMKREYICENIQAHRQGYLVKLNGVQNRTDSEALKGQEIYVDEELLTSVPGEQIYLREIENFELVNPQGSSLGFIRDFSSNGLQDLLVVETPRGRFDVPFVEDFLVEIRFEQKKVVMDLPVGLLGEDSD